MLGLLDAVLHNPKHASQHRNIFLLSHMRAYTSLFGHILGSHPEIEGYYEMHIGYYSWKSLWRQKLLYFASHKAKKSSRILFDKLLHNYCFLAPNIAGRPSTRLIFMLRQPEPSIHSIVRLYDKVDPDHEFATEQGATEYYIERLAQLKRSADTLVNGFYYLDAETLIEAPEETLHALSAWLDLNGPLSTNYQVFSKTGKPQAGDSSELLSSGQIAAPKKNRERMPLGEELLKRATTAYTECRSALLDKSEKSTISTTPR